MQTGQLAWKAALGTEVTVASGEHISYAASSG